MRAATGPVSADFVRSAIREMSAYELAPRTAPDKLDQNESPFDLPLEWKREVMRRVEARSWNRYPDFELVRARTALADATAMEPGNILVGNGSNELLLAALATFVSDGTKVIYPSPTFPLYHKLVTIFGGKAHEIPFDPATGRLPVSEMLEAASFAAEPPVFIVCSPNNPTGGALRGGELDRLLASGGLVLLDRAYGEFSSSPAPPVHPRLVTFSTLSKASGLAGLRIGWLSAPAELCREIRKVKLPYSLNIFSEEALVVSLERAGLTRERVRMIVEERDRLDQALMSIEGVEPFPSEANFIAFRVGRGCTAVFESLLRNGTLVRDVSRYPSLENVLRVSVGTREENDRFLAALANAMKGTI